MTDAVFLPPTTSFNISDLEVLQVRDGSAEVTRMADPAYQEFLTDVWVGIVLTLMVVSCVCFMCSCLVYHKIQEWKDRAHQSHIPNNQEAGSVESDLPSYTIVSGLPTYEEALEQLKKVKEQRQEKSDSCEKPVPEPSAGTGPLSVFNLFNIYNKNGEDGTLKPS
ncbi:protein commissureless 2 homolog [Sitophilus oryzae]|uniref:Protein commissureless 2 homolog n=1 Tax=Sitophilus oryzae TaxID=7048 RepID=A0A6J2XNL0_SITOR|nr:protein commissureless 2 homolog [Sitophilus oryzae]